MTSQHQQKILRDLLKIFQKYDQDEIVRALNALQSGEALNNFVKLGREASKLVEVEGASSHRKASNLRKRTDRSTRAELDKFIATLLASEIKQHQDIGIVLRAAANREILATSRLLQKLFVTLGLPTSASGDRLSMIRALGDYLLTLNPEDVSALLQLAKESGTRESSLQRWTDIIVQKNRNDRE